MQCRLMDSRKLDMEIAPKEEEKLWFNEHLIVLGRLVIDNLLYQMIRKSRAPAMFVVSHQWLIRRFIGLSKYLAIDLSKSLYVIYMQSHPVLLTIDFKSYIQHLFQLSYLKTNRGFSLGWSITDITVVLFTIIYLMIK